MKNVSIYPWLFRKNIGIAVLTGKGQWNAVNLDKSIENINKLKYSVYNYESRKIVIYEKRKGELFYENKKALVYNINIYIFFYLL